MSKTIEREKLSGPGSGVGGNWNVIVLNDNHNTFDHVAHTLAKVIPGITVQRGYSFANLIHNSGQAIVWSGPLELAELRREQLRHAGLTLAPLERS